MDCARCYFKLEELKSENEFKPNWVRIKNKFYKNPKIQSENIFKIFFFFFFPSKKLFIEKAKSAVASSYEFNFTFFFFF